MIEFEQACDLVLENTERLGIEERLIENSIGYALARDIVSDMDVAPFRNSAMDGFAVESSWLRECSKDNPCAIPLGPTLYAGQSDPSEIAGNHAIKVMTGARIPAGFDAVVPFEETEFDAEQVRFFAPVDRGHHVREPGEDITRGQKLFAEGSTIGRLDIGVLATIGLRSIPTYRKPSALIFGTGDELIEPGEKLSGDRIYDSNAFVLQAMVAPFCEKAERLRRVRDQKDDLLRALDSPHDVLVVSGGVSVGERDLVVGMAESCGWQKIFHKVRIKPGKPVYFSRRGRQILIGLPGNPLSATISCAMFLIPALRKMSGMAEYRLCSDPMVLAEGEHRKTSGRTLIWPGNIREEEGRRVARYSPKTSSAAMTALLNTDGLIISDIVVADTGEAFTRFVPWDRILRP